MPVLAAGPSIGPTRRWVPTATARRSATCNRLAGRPAATMPRDRSDPGARRAARGDAARGDRRPDGRARAPGERRLAHPPSDRYRADETPPADGRPRRRRRRSRAASPSRSRPPSSGAVAIVMLGGVLTRDGGPHRRRRGDRLGSRGRAFGSGPARTLPARPPGRRSRSSSPSARSRSASSGCGSTHAPRAASWRRSTTSARCTDRSSRSSSWRRRSPPGWRPMSDGIRSDARPRPTTRVVVGQVDDWWGGRKVHQLLPRLWFQHFTGTSWVAEDADGPAGRVPRRVRQPRPSGRGLHPHGRDEPEPSTAPDSAGRSTSGSSTTCGPVACVGSAPSRGPATGCRSGSIGRWGSAPFDGARDAEPVRHAGLSPTTTPTATTGSSSAGSSDRGRRAPARGAAARSAPRDPAPGRRPASDGAAPRPRAYTKM